ncbi:MAG: TRAP transporter small permease subunit [Lentibacter sp.]|uniref:TRAP transporter small permease subunit n=1 Tax=Lentibacter sp. TaxID=2024994 RepID=UPI002632F859|nr:TRAP transporter small permease subunit [Lentibacter sp.]MDG1290160.1 TRAP transporter small permease subunit [Lentibacter sp.]
MKFVYAIEGLSLWVGRAFGWCILILTLSVSYEVFVRYVLNSPTVWAFDMMIQMYGALFLMCGAYALAQDNHVRADVIYRLFPVKVQASLDFVLYLLFFFPGVIALAWYGWEIASDSWRYKEVSFNSPASIQIYFFKSLIPIAGFLLALQGVAELLRCVMVFRTGVWPERLVDVRETEDLLTDADFGTINSLAPENKKIVRSASRKIKR